MGADGERIRRDRGLCACIPKKGSGTFQSFQNKFVLAALQASKGAPSRLVQGQQGRLSISNPRACSGASFPMANGSCRGQRPALRSNLSPHSASVWRLGREPVSAACVSHARGASVDANRREITNDVLHKLQRRVPAFVAEPGIAAFSRDSRCSHAAIRWEIGP